MAKSRRTSYRTQPKRVGSVYTLKFKTRVKRWVKRQTKKLWRKAKAKVRKQYRKVKRSVQHRWQQRGNHQQIARTARQFQRHHTQVHTRVAATHSQPDGETRTLPPGGATASCRRCSNEVMYNDSRGRWEHTGRGNYECFQPR